MANERALNELARLLKRTDRGSQIAQELSGKMQPTFGKIVDVEDPERRGRVKIVLDNTNPEFATADGYEQKGSPTKTDWVSPATPFKGVQPEKMVGLRVPVKARDGDPNRLSFGTPIYDPEEYTPGTDKTGNGAGAQSRSGGSESGTADGELPENSDMVRCAVYPAGSLPDASAENIGCMVIEEGGPMESDWLCVCLKRKGEYYWVRHIDMNHGHAGEDDGQQQPDTDGDGEVPVEELTVWDFVFPTTHEEYEKNSMHGTDPRANPFGDEAKWHGGA
jgi:hypothetical protein